MATIREKVRQLIDQIDNARAAGSVTNRMLASVLNYFFGDKDVFDELDKKADKNSVYTKTETDTKLAGKADKNSVYTKTETDTKLSFDISAYHATGGTLATYDNLEDALGTNGKNIPQSLKKGGMSVKFVQSSDNKYVQYRLTTAAWSVNIFNWQNVDITKMSINFSDWQYQGKFVSNTLHIGDVISFSNSNNYSSFKIFVAKDNILQMNNIYCADNSSKIYITDLNNTIIEIIDKGTGYNSYKYIASQNCYVVSSSYNKIGSCYVKQLNLTELDNIPKAGSKNPISSEAVFYAVNPTEVITEPTQTNTYINNFGKAIIGSEYIPSYDRSSFMSFAIPVKAGDIINIDQKKTFANTTVDKIVFVDKNNIVVEPTTSLQPPYNTVICDLNFVAVEDGYMFFSTYNLIPSTIKITRSLDTIVRSLEKIEENIDTENEEIVATTYLDCPINRQTDIFLDGIIRVEDDVKRKPYRVVGNATIVQIGDNQLRMTPTALTNANITIYKYADINMNNVSSSKSFVFRPVSRTVGDGSTIKNICICGDSLIDGTNAPCEAFRLLNEDGDFVIHQIGTRNATMDGVTYKHEGRGSWKWATYIDTRYGVYTDSEHPVTPYSNKLNEFMIDEELNFQKYMQRNFPDEVSAGRGIDIFIMSLGTNDVTQGSVLLTDTSMNQIINNAKIFIDTLLSADKGYPNCKIVIALPAVGAKSFIGATTFSSVFKMSILKLNKAYIDNFDNGAYHQNVTCVMHGCYIDRENSYQYEDVGRNDYINDDALLSLINSISDINTKNAIQYIADNYVSHRKTRKCKNQVHPQPVGYKQWGRGYYGKLRAILNGLL